MRWRKRVRVVRIENGDGSLEQDGAGVGTFVDQVHRATGELHPVLERLSLRVDTRKSRQQCRVNVHDPVRKGGQHRSGQYAHEPGEDDPRHAVRAQCLRQCGIERFPVFVVTMRNRPGFDAGVPRAFQCWRAGLVRYDYLDGRIETPVGNGVRDRGEVRSGSRDEDAEGKGHR